MNLWEISLRQARREEVPLLLALQVEAFTPLYLKYQDHATSPARDTLENLNRKFDRPDSTYWFIVDGPAVLGVIRLVQLEGGRRCRVSPLFVRPEYQRRGVARTALFLAEKIHGQARVWELDTIREETALCRLYESAGYRPTGTVHPIQEGMTSVGYEKST